MNHYELGMRPPVFDKFRQDKVVYETQLQALQGKRSEYVKAAAKLGENGRKTNFDNSPGRGFDYRH